MDREIKIRRWGKSGIETTREIQTRRQVVERKGKILEKERYQKMKEIERFKIKTSLPGLRISATEAGPSEV